MVKNRTCNREQEGRILISGIIDFKTAFFSSDQDEHFIMMEESIYQEDVTDISM